MRNKLRCRICRRAIHNSINKIFWKCSLLIILIAANAWNLKAGNETISGELIIERPTLISVGFEWRITGDENGDASCRVQYRKSGDMDWKEYLPLYRIGLRLTVQNSMISRGDFYTIPDALAGSIMDLEPGTKYEIKLQLQDAGGVSGETNKTIKERTRMICSLSALSAVRG